MEIAWPIDYGPERRRRAIILERIGLDETNRKLANDYYRNRPVEWIADCCFTYDPRIKKGSKVIPFILFPRQVEFIWFLMSCITDKEAGLVEKSRDVGASWLCCAFSVWLWLYHPGTAVGWGSRKEDYVDKKGDMKAIFPKMRLIMDHLPPWMLPSQFMPFMHSNHMKIINPENGASITGEAGDNMGRGGRTTIYFKDESAHYENPDSIEASLGDNTDVQIDISSVNGTANIFYRRRQAGIEWLPDTIIPEGKTRVFIFDWRDHPGKTVDWYNRRRAKAEEEGLMHVFSQEVDRDYSSAVQGIIIPQIWVKASIDAHVRLSWPESRMKIAGFDPYDEGRDKHALAYNEGSVLVYAEDWSQGDTGEATREVVDICKFDGVLEVYYDSLGVGAGVKSEYNRLKKAGLIPRGMRFHAWNASLPPLDPEKAVIRGDWEDGDKGPTNEDIYQNLNAQSYWRLRTRFQKTFKAITSGEKYQPGEMISLDSSLPRLHEVCNQLSQPVRKQSEKTGKMMIDKKPEGASSPNIADAVKFAYNPVKRLSILDVV